MWTYPVLQGIRPCQVSPVGLDALVCPWDLEGLWTLEHQVPQVGPLFPQSELADDLFH